jgi:hypothetical protein
VKLISVGRKYLITQKISISSPNRLIKFLSLNYEETRHNHKWKDSNNQRRPKLMAQPQATPQIKVRDNLLYSKISRGAVAPIR